MNHQRDNQGAEGERYIRFQFWLSDHGQPVLFNHWSDGYIEEAEVMLPDRLVDLQHWDTHSGIILNHLVDTGWQTGTMPYGIDPDEPIPEILSDHETLREPASQPPVTKKALNPASVPQTPREPPKAPQAPSPQREAPSQIQPLEIPICVLPNPDIAKRSVHQREPERSRRLFSSICGWIALLVFLFLISRFSSGRIEPAALQHNPDSKYG